MGLKQLQTNEIRTLCENSRVKSLFAFGSVTRYDFNVDSDINLVVGFD